MTVKIHPGVHQYMLKVGEKEWSTLDEYTWRDADFLQGHLLQVQLYTISIPDLMIIFEFRPKGSDTVNTVFVLHCQTSSTGLLWTSGFSEYSVDIQ
jgi:hypothetical protein